MDIGVFLRVYMCPGRPGRSELGGLHYGRGGLPSVGARLWRRRCRPCAPALGQGQQDRLSRENLVYAFSNWEFGNQCGVMTTQISGRLQRTAANQSESDKMRLWFHVHTDSDRGDADYYGPVKLILLVIETCSIPVIEEDITTL